MKKIIKIAFICITALAIMLAIPFFSAFAHNLYDFSLIYTWSAANSTNSFVIEDDYHPEGNTVCYFWDSASLSLMANNTERQNFRDALEGGFPLWGGLIARKEITEVNAPQNNANGAHMKIWYNNDSTLTYWAGTSRNGSNTTDHFRFGLQSNGKYDAEIHLTREGKKFTLAKQTTIMAHELGHNFGVKDLYNYDGHHPGKENLVSIYSDRQLNTYTSPTRHDKNAMLIGLDAPWYYTGVTSGNDKYGIWKYQKSPGVWAVSSESIGGITYKFNANGTVELILGDLNNDDTVTAAESRTVLRFCARLTTLTPIQCMQADMNRDGQITALDARKILRISSRLDGQYAPW